MATTPVQIHDAMHSIDEQDAATRERFIERLEFRATDPTFTAYAMERRSQAAAR